MLPSLRRGLVEVMHEELRLSRVEVARKLRISQSAVSRYLYRERGASIDVSRHPELMREIKALADEVAHGDLSWYDLESRLLRIALHALSRKYFCSYHQRLDPEVNPATCRICPETFQVTQAPKQNPPTFQAVD